MYHPRTERRDVTEIVATGFAYPSLVVDNAEFFARCRFPIVNEGDGAGGQSAQCGSRHDSDSGAEHRGTAAAGNVRLLLAEGR